MAESKRGTLLLPRAAVHLASPLTRMKRIVLHSPSASTSPFAGPPGNASAAQPRTALLWAGTDGSVGYVAPLEEAAFRRLYFLSTKMIVGLPHACGLHPRAFRAMQTSAGSAKELKRYVICKM